MNTTKNSIPLRIVFWGGTIILIVFLTTGCDKRKKNPRIVFEQEIHDCGILTEENHKVVKEFVFRNRGNSPLRILGTKTSCSCMVTEYPKGEILPGDSGKVVFSAGFKPGTRKEKASVVVHTNDPEMPFVRLSIIALVRADIAVNVVSLDFGKVDTGTIAEEEFEVRVPGARLADAQGQIKLTTSSSKISVKLLKKRKVVAQLGELPVLTYLIRVNTKGTTGDIKETLTIRRTKTGSSREIPVVAKVVGNLQIEPETLFLGLLSNNDSIRKTVRIVSRKQSEFKVTKADITATGFEITTKILGPHIYELHITSLPEHLPSGPIKAEIVVRTDDKLQPTISIPVHGYVPF